MDARHAPFLVDLLRSLPPAGQARDLGLQKLTDTYAAAEAKSALEAAAARSRTTAGAEANVLIAAAAAWDALPPNWGQPPLKKGPVPNSAERLAEAVTGPAFLATVPAWIGELREIASTHPGTGACTVATAMRLWSWTMNYFHAAQAGPRATAIAELADAFAPLLAARCRILEIARDAAGRPGSDQFPSDVCHVQSAHAAAAAGTICAELVFGYRRHLAWDAEGCATCYGGEELDELEGFIPGIASAARAHADVIEADGSHAAKAGPCARFDGVETFTQLRARLDGCLTGARLAKDRAAAALPQIVSAATSA